MAAVVRSDSSAPARGNQLESPTVRIDPVLRKALLKALSNLEKESDELEENLTDGLISTTESEELLEESTTNEKQMPTVQFTTFMFDRNSTKGVNDNAIYKTIILPKTTLSPPKADSGVAFNAPDPVKESDIKIETVQLARSVSTSIQANEINDERKISDQILELSKPTTTFAPTAPTTTTTTTEAPVTNADGENIEKVNDVQIHEAPLVAAFTVQQDAQGLPKSVMPIFKQIIDPVKSNSKPQNRPQFTGAPNNFAVNPYQLALEQKQRELEQRIQYLQAQQRHQEQLFRQQQFQQDQQIFQRQEQQNFQRQQQEQQNFQRQQQQIFFEQRLRQDEENRLRLQRYEQEQRLRLQQLQRNQVRQGGLSNIQLLPSVSLTSNQGILIDQQLPVREPTNFRITQDQQLPSFQQANFNPQEQSSNQNPLQLPQQLQLPQRQFVPINTQVNIIPSVSASFSSTQLKNNNIDPGLLTQESNSGSLTRVFRQEVPNQVNFEQQKSQQIVIPPNSNLHNLQHLLFNSGVAGRTQEDLNIITRVLALNHGITAPLNSFVNNNNGQGNVRNNFV